jgi:hypothetical protein
VLQTVLQALALSQMYGAHDFAVPAAHAPAPSQYAMLVRMPEAHDAAAQLVEVPLIEAHLVRSAPSHVAWQTPDPAHAVRAPWTAPATATHVPTLPPTSQASHWPEHALSQQTPSTQFPDPHSAFAVHATPRGFEHVPKPLALHVSGAAHDATTQQTPSTHLPDPHCDGLVQTLPAAPVVTQTPPLQK